MMETISLIDQLEWLRAEIVGRNILFETCFGKKPLIYADYTASGRNLYFLENFMLHLMQYYANTHTEDDFTGKVMTSLLHEAERKIKHIVNAKDTGKIIFTESGTTGGITRLQQILGVYWPPATKERVDRFLDSCLERYPDKVKCNEELKQHINSTKPIVFVGPYEHHSNELMWRKTLCEVVEIPLNSVGEIDLKVLAKTVADKKYKHRDKIGSFSAASNVTGIKTDVYEVAKILHYNKALACFDFAACAPYIEIDMNRSREEYFDAIFLSPHKFLGGPGTSGILIFHEKIYNKHLPPCIAAGGTVDFVSEDREKYIDDIETREKPGTPAILQNIKVAMVFQIKEEVGVDKIEKIENYYIKRFYEHYRNNDRIIFYGPLDPEKKLAIIPFNIKHKDRILHPKFVTKLMNDLFGVQTRAGCSCAGPYGHKLLKITKQLSKYYQCVVGVDKFSGLKPGWVRLNLHYTLSLTEFDYIIKVLDFVIEKGDLFLPYYHFDFHSGDWHHVKQKECKFPLCIELDFAKKLKKFKLPTNYDIEKLYAEMLRNAEEISSQLESRDDYPRFDKHLEELIFFYVLNYRI